jgi:xanthine dehydrogenase FAD-binding subunit
VKKTLPKFDYLAPQTLEEALDLLEQYGEGAKVLAGGTDLIVILRAKELQPKYLIDIKEIKELHDVSYGEKRELKIGAAATINKILHHDVVSKNFPILAEAISTIGDFQVRNRATLVGNICNASPAADSAPALLVLDATVNIAGKRGRRTVPIREFFAGVKKTVLSKREIVTSISVPTPPEGSVGSYQKARRTLGEDLAVVGVGALVIPNGKAGKGVRLAYSSVAPTPVRSFESEKFFENGKALDILDQVMPFVRKNVCPISDVRGGKEYRMNLIEILTRRLVSKLWEAA